MPYINAEILTAQLEKSIQEWGAKGRFSVDPVEATAVSDAGDEPVRMTMAKFSGELFKSGLNMLEVFWWTVFFSYETKQPEVRALVKVKGQLM